MNSFVKTIKNFGKKTTTKKASTPVKKASKKSQPVKKASNKKK